MLRTQLTVGAFLAPRLYRQVREHARSNFRSIILK
jgi:hypothetical protein